MQQLRRPTPFLFLLIAAVAAGACCTQAWPAQPRHSPGQLAHKMSTPQQHVQRLRDQVRHGLMLADGAKVAVAEFYIYKGRFPRANASAGLAHASSIQGDYLASLTVAHGKIVLRYSSTPPQKANKELDGKTLVLSPAADGGGNIQWPCHSASIPAQYLPSACK